MTRTRFAPTLSGELHLGSLYNALLNWAWAHKSSGEFFVRFDGVQRSKQREEFGYSILRDLEFFGLIPDGVIWQWDRRDIYMNELMRLLDSPSTYVCDCTEGEIFDRISEHPENFKVLHREEKYPGQCAIKTVVVTEAGKQPGIVKLAGARAYMSSRDTSPDAVLDFTGSVWKPVDVGYLGYDSPGIWVDFEEPSWVTGATVYWDYLPPVAVRYYVDEKSCMTITRDSRYWYYNRTNGPYQGVSQAETITFPPIYGRSFGIVIGETLKQVRKEYFYDGYCRDKGKKFDKAASKTVVRIMGNDDAPLDVAIYYGKNPNLVLNSAYDEKAMGITDVIRGWDIEEFSQMEALPAGLLEYRPNQHFHSMITDENYVKLSKFVGSPPARNYVKDGNTLEVLNALCSQTGIVGDCVHDINSFPSVINFDVAFGLNEVISVDV